MEKHKQFAKKLLGNPEGGKCSKSPSQHHREEVREPRQRRNKMWLVGPESRNISKTEKLQQVETPVQQVENKPWECEHSREQEEALPNIEVVNL